MQNAKIQLSSSNDIDRDAECKDSTQVEEWTQVPDRLFNGTCLVASLRLSQVEPGRNDVFVLANAIQIEVLKIYQPPED